ncbi:hypothetical protein PVK06_029669 [Gossypium arboreum]|uniref:Uncharacterized protein n=1 Tax=Gossypium arboreum TaxID=29729 RepID=A0ABR0NM89_GOSAR|nr:hypothetical protein PVK06_029669 [Gossypium arboreum]
MNEERNKKMKQAKVPKLLADASRKEEERLMEKRNQVFLSLACSKRYLSLAKKSFIKEQNIDETSFTDYEIDTILENNGLI